MNRQLSMLPRASYRELTAKVDALSSHSHIRLTLVLESLLVLVSVFASLLVASAFTFLGEAAETEQLYRLFDILFLVVFFGMSFFLSAPLVLGLVRTACLLERGEMVGIDELFHYFVSPGTYIRGLGILALRLSCLIPFAVGIGMFCSIPSMLVDAPENEGAAAMVPIAVVFGIVALFLGFLLESIWCGFTGICVSDDTLSFWIAMQISSKASLGQRMLLLGDDLKLALRLILSILPIAIPFFLKALPDVLLYSAARAEDISSREPQKP